MVSSDMIQASRLDRDNSLDQEARFVIVFSDMTVTSMAVSWIVDKLESIIVIV